MPTTQKALSSSKVNDTSESTGWNYPRCIASAVDPTAADDDSKGFWQGSIWVNYATPALFYCSDPSTASAVWVQVLNA